jgi:hypothetical protein
MDGFVAAIRASAPVAAAPTGGPAFESLEPSGGGSKMGALFGGAIGIVAVAVVVFAFHVLTGAPGYTLTPQSLTIHDRFYPVTLAAGSEYLEHVRVVDVGVEADWRPTAPTNGFANVHYRAGWRTGRRCGCIAPTGHGLCCCRQRASGRRR